MDVRAHLKQAQAALGPITDLLKAVARRQEVRWMAEWVKDFAPAFAVIFAGSTALAQPSYVPSGSMQPTLGIGDVMLVEKYAYGYSQFSLPYGGTLVPDFHLFTRLPARGDVAVFRTPRDTSVTFVKRVVGLPGDRIQMRGGRLWINGRELPLRYDGDAALEDEDGGISMLPSYIETLPDGRKHRIFKTRWDGRMDDTAVYLVPPGHVFMMGDNRDNSCDSRYPVEECGVGYVPVGNLVGRAPVVLASVDFKNADGVWEWPLRLRLSRTLDRVR